MHSIYPNPCLASGRGGEGRGGERRGGEGPSFTFDLSYHIPLDTHLRECGRCYGDAE